MVRAHPETDTLVNCAGFTSYGAFANLQWEQQRAIIMVNTLATARLCHHYLTGMIRQGHGQILNVSSTAGESFAPYYATYVGTKALVLQFTRSLSLEMPDGVSVSCLIPGPTATEFCSRAGMRPMRRGRLFPEADPREVAEFGVRLMESGLLSGSQGTRTGLKRAIKRCIPKGVWSNIARVHMSSMKGT